MSQTHSALETPIAPAALSLPARTDLAAVFYDLDGTLAHTDPIHFLAWQACLRDVGLTIDEAFYKHRISGRLNPAIVADLLPHLSLEDGLAFADQKEARFRTIAQTLTPLPGVEVMLEWAQQQNLPQVLVTNAPPENVRFILETLSLDRAFETIILAEELPHGKPDPLPYQVALDRLNLEPQQVITFEDSPSGIRSAVAAGITTIGITSSHDPHQLQALGATLTIADFTAPTLWDWLNSAE